MQAETVAATSPGAGPRLDHRVAGWGGVVFVTIVVIQNVVRATAAPAPDATLDEIVAFAVDDRTTIALLTAFFVLNVPFISVFVAEVYRRGRDGAEPVAARVGLLGWTGVMALFALTVTGEMGLAVAGERLEEMPGVALTFWTINNVAFALNMAMLAVAFLGLGLTAVGAGIAPARYRWLAPAGAVLLLVSGAFGVAVAEGHPVMGAGLVGFLLWLSFVVTCGLRLARMP